MIYYLFSVLAGTALISAVIMRKSGRNSFILIRILQIAGVVLLFLPGISTIFVTMAPWLRSSYWQMSCFFGFFAGVSISLALVVSGVSVRFQNLSAESRAFKNQVLVSPINIGFVVAAIFVGWFGFGKFILEFLSG